MLLRFHVASRETLLHSYYVEPRPAQRAFLATSRAPFTGETTKPPCLQGFEKKRMKGLEPSTFCMAKASERSRTFARVRSNRLSARLPATRVNPSEPERTPRSSTSLLACFLSADALIALLGDEEPFPGLGHGARNAGDRGATAESSDRRGGAVGDGVRRRHGARCATRRTGGGVAIRSAWRPRESSCPPQMSTLRTFAGQPHQ